MPTAKPISRKLITCQNPAPKTDPIDHVGQVVPGITNADGTPCIYSIQDAINEQIGNDEEDRINPHTLKKPGPRSSNVGGRKPNLTRADICMLARIGFGQFVKFLPCRDRVEEKSFVRLKTAGVINGQPGCFTIEETLVSPGNTNKIVHLRRLCQLLEDLAWGSLETWEPRAWGESYRFQVTYVNHPMPEPEDLINRLKPGDRLFWGSTFVEVVTIKPFVVREVVRVDQAKVIETLEKPPAPSEPTTPAPKIEVLNESLTPHFAYVGELPRCSCGQCEEPAQYMVTFVNNSFRCKEHMALEKMIFGGFFEGVYENRITRLIHLNRGKGS